MTVKQINILMGVAVVLALTWIVCVIMSPWSTLGYTLLGLVILALIAAFGFAIYKLRDLLLYVFNDEYRAAADAKNKPKGRGW